MPLIFRGRQEGLVEERGLLVKPGIQEEGAGGCLPSWCGRAPFPRGPLWDLAASLFPRQLDEGRDAHHVALGGFTYVRMSAASRAFKARLPRKGVWAGPGVQEPSEDWGHGRNRITSRFQKGQSWVAGGMEGKEQGRRGGGSGLWGRGQGDRWLARQRQMARREGIR